MHEVANVRICLHGAFIFLCLKDKQAILHPLWNADMMQLVRERVRVESVTRKQTEYSFSMHLL